MVFSERQIDTSNLFNCIRLSVDLVIIFFLHSGFYLKLPKSTHKLLAFLHRAEPTFLGA